MYIFLYLAVKTDQFGTDVEDLDRKLTEYRAQSKIEISDKLPFWTVVYVITVFNNPTGTCLPPGEKNWHFISIYLLIELCTLYIRLINTLIQLLK